MTTEELELNAFLESRDIEVLEPTVDEALAMIADAEANGGGFIPGSGQVSAVICDLGPDVQLNIIEVICPGGLEV